MIRLILSTGKLPYYTVIETQVQTTVRVVDNTSHTAPYEVTRVASRELQYYYFRKNIHTVRDEYHHEPAGGAAAAER